MAILKQCEGLDERLVFNIKTSQLDALFRKAKKQCLIDNLHFHDSRGLAITRLASKLDILELAKVCGHKDLSMLQVYYRKTAQDLVDKLD
jgi:integrase